jgi:predicted MFS family arabinose efflux permease
MAFNSQGTQLLLQRLGVPDPWLAPVQTLSQTTEVLSLALLPMLHLRLGLRNTMFLGLAAWTLGLSAFAWGGPLWLVIVMLGTWGTCVSCYLVSGQVFVNSRARGDIRTSAQGLLTFVNGLGMLIGNLLAGGIRDQLAGALLPTFAVAAGFMVVVLFVFLSGFSEKNGNHETYELHEKKRKSREKSQQPTRSRGRNSAG